MNSLEKGDSIRIETNLNKLQKEKQLLNDLLKNIKTKVKDKVKQLETKKSQINRLIADKNNLFEELNQLRDQSIAVEDNAKRIERNINERRNCFQQLKQEFNERRKQQSIIIDSICGDFDELSQKFMNLTLIHSCAKLSDKINEMDEEIKAKTEERLLLKEKFDKLQEKFNKQLSENEVKFPDYKWSDWPISERMIAYDIFIEENHLVHENLIRIRESQDSKLY